MLVLGDTKGKESARWLERRSRWGRVLDGIEKGRHPSPAELAELVEAVGVVPGGDAALYLAARLRGEVQVPGGRPTRLSIPPAADLARKDLERANKEIALELYERHRERYSRFESGGRPRNGNRRRLRFVRSREVWRVKNPKQEAARRIGKRFAVSKAELEHLQRERAKSAVT